MIEKVIYDYLSEKLDPTKVFMEIPTAPPARCVVVEKQAAENENIYAIQLLRFSLTKTVCIMQQFLMRKSKPLWNRP